MFQVEKHVEYLFNRKRDPIVDNKKIKTSFPVVAVRHVCVKEVSSFTPTGTPQPATASNPGPAV
jgi:hypothetical protein